MIIIQAMRLMSELCLYYNIEDVTLWTKLLDQLLELNMVNECSYKGGNPYCIGSILEAFVKGIG